VNYRFTLLTALVLTCGALPATVRADAQADLNAGKLAAEAGDFDKALTLLASAAQTLPQSVEAQLAFADLYLKRGESDKALEKYQAVLKLSPNHVAAKRIVEALTGGRQTYDQKMALAKSFIKLGSFDLAARVAQQALIEATSVEQREQARLLHAYALLWAQQPAALEEALKLIQGGQAAQGGRAIAAIMLLIAAEPNVERATAVLAELPEKPAADAAWNELANLAKLLIAAEDEAQAANVSRQAAKVLAAVPSGPLQSAVVQRLLDRLEKAAQANLRKGNPGGAIEIAVPMVATGAVPELLDTKLNGGWVPVKLAKGTAWVRAAKLLAGIGQWQAYQTREAPPTAARLALIALLQLDEGELRNPALLEVVNQLAAAARVSPTRKPGEPLNASQKLLAETLVKIRPLLSNDEQRQVWVSVATGLISRYEGVDDLEYAVGLFGLQPFTGKDGKLELTFPAQQSWLGFLAGKEAALGQKAFNEAAATQAANANATVNKHDLNALTLYATLLRLFPDDGNPSTAAHAILDRYAVVDQWAAVVAGAETFYGGSDGRSRAWALLQLKLRQAQWAEEKLFASNRQLPKELPAVVQEALTAALKEYQMQPTKPIRRRLIGVVEPLIARYAGVNRRDLADAILTAVTAAKEEKLADWLLWVQITLQSQESTRAFNAVLAQSPEPKKLTLIPAHQTELDQLGQLISKYAESEYFARALARVSEIANLYQHRGAYDTAIGVLAAFIKAQPTLRVSEKLEFDIVQIHLQKAQQAFTDRPEKTKPPEKLLPESQATIDAIAAYLKAHPTSPNAAQALQTLLQIARTYGEAKAWPVAREVLARFATAAPDFRSPSQLKLWQAATYLGELDVGQGLALLQPPVPPTKGAVHGGGGGGLAFTRSLLEDAEGDKKSLDEVSKLAKGDKNGGFGGGFAYSGQNKYSDRVDISGVGGNVNGPAGTPTPAEPATPPPPVTASSAAPPPAAEKPADPAALASQLAINQARRSSLNQIAMMKDQPGGGQQPQSNVDGGAIVLPTGPVLTEAEMKRQDDAADKAYAILIDLVKNAPLTEVMYAEQARGHIGWLFNFFEGQLRADHAVTLIKKFLTDRPNDSQKVQLAYRILNDQLTWAGQRQLKDRIDKKWLDVRHKLFEAARQEIAKFIKDFAERKDWVSQARLLSVDSYEREAGLAAVVSPVRAAGLLANGVEALLTLYKSSPDHPAVGNFPERMWNTAERLRALQQDELSIQVLSQIPMYFPLNPRAQQAVMRIAELYATNLINPLRAVETYQEYLSVVGDNEAVRAQIFSIAQQLAAKQRYLEALHVYGVFVDSFPTDQRAPEALRAIGQTHQANEAWDDAIKAYQRIVDQFPAAPILPQVQLALAECEINLSKWTSARKRYEDFIAKYPQDGQVATAKQRIDVLKQLDRYQTLLADDQVQRNKDDAQYQIGAIVNERLNNKVKAIEEFRKVVKNFGKSSQAAAAQLEIGKALLALNKLDDAREELLRLPKNHPGSPLADDALYLIGQSYEQAAQRLAGVTLEKARSEAYEQGQRGAYQQFADLNRAQEQTLSKRRSELKSSGKANELALDEASSAWRFNGGNLAVVSNSTICAEQMAETASALQVANRQDKINDAYRQAVAMYARVANEYPLGDVTDKSLLRMAQIQESELKDRKGAMETYQKIVKHFPGTPVAENAAWRVAEFYEQEGKYKEAVDAYREFIRNYPASGKVADAQFAVAEALEQLNRWVEAMEAYETFRQKFTNHPKAQAALEQINWIRAYRK